MNLVEVLNIPAATAPDQPAVTFSGRTWTYKQMSQRTQRLAGAMAAIGVGPGDVVGLLATNSPAFIDVLMASAWLGAAFVPLNYRAKPDELAHLLQDSGICLLILEERYEELVTSVAESAPKLRQSYSLGKGEGRFPSFQSLVKTEGSTPSPHPGGDHLALLMYTSGTTGLPKPVPMRHSDLLSYTLSSGEVANGTSRGANLICAPLYHVAGCTAVLTSLFSGLRLVFLPQFDPSQWLAMVAAERITHAFLVPTMLKQVLEQPEIATADLSSLQLLSYGAAPMPLATIMRAIESLPSHLSFSQAFGQTETTGTLSLLGPEDHRLEGAPEVVEARRRRLASVGQPLPDVEVRIMAADGSALPTESVGEVLVRSRRINKGDFISAATDEGEPWHHTGDLGWLDSGGYLFLAGRGKDLIIRAGENISPMEVEVVLMSHPAVADAAVVGLPDEEWGERVAAAVVLRHDQSIAAEELHAYCKARLASFKVPQRFEFVATLPRNPLGKVLKRVIREQMQ